MASCDQDFWDRKDTIHYFSCSLLYFLVASSELKWNSVPEVLMFKMMVKLPCLSYFDSPLRVSSGKPC